jgi:SAM-dependent methyltransferase
MTCPLCGSEHAGKSWLGTIYYRTREFPYLVCRSCGSLYCAPMPDAVVLAEMYGPDYTQEGGAAGHTENPKEPERVVEWLGRFEPGTFVDYGCGQGELLTAARDRGWKAVGVEFSEEVARRTRQQTGLPVFAKLHEVETVPTADVLHLGDVIEHLTRLDEQMPEILKLLKPGGLLLAQGPLEANTSLFTSALIAARRLRPGRRTEMPPYHVLLATARGQREFFRRLNLEEIEYTLREVAWPAPDSIALADLGRPRTLGLFALRRCSRAISALRPQKWGNRYFYVGRKVG